MASHKPQLLRQCRVPPPPSLLVEAIGDAVAVRLGWDGVTRKVDRSGPRQPPNANKQFCGLKIVPATLRDRLDPFPPKPRNCGAETTTQPVLRQLPRNRPNVEWRDRS